MKKIICILLAVLFVAFSLMGCGVKSDLLRPNDTFPRDYPVY